IRSISSAASGSFSRPLEPSTPYRISACTPSRSWSFSLSSGSVRRRMPFLPSSYRPVEAMRSDRWMTPGTYSRPAEPMPFIRPNLAPLALTHSGPFGPSTTWGMRSLRAAEALLVNRSGGSQIRSTWPSAEMTSYFMARSSARDHPPVGRAMPVPSICLAIHPRPVLRRRHQQDERRGERQDHPGGRDGVGADRESEVQVVDLQRHNERAARGIHPEIGKGAELPLA